MSGGNVRSPLDENQLMNEDERVAFTTELIRMTNDHTYRRFVDALTTFEATRERFLREAADIFGDKAAMTLAPLLQQCLGSVTHELLMSAKVKRSEMSTRDDVNPMSVDEVARLIDYRNAEFLETGHKDYRHANWQEGLRDSTDTCAVQDWSVPADGEFRKQPLPAPSSKAVKLLAEARKRNVEWALQAPQGQSDLHDVANDLTCWSTDTDTPLTVWYQVQPQTIGAHVIHELCPLPNNRLATGSRENSVRLWDVTTAEQVGEFNGHMANIKSLVRLPNTRLASGDKNGVIRVWDYQTRECVLVLNGHTACVFSLNAMNGHRFVSGARDGEMRVWDSDSGKCLRVFSGAHPGGVWRSLYFRHQDKDMLLSAGFTERKIKLWDGETSACLLTIAAPDSIGDMTVFPHLFKVAVASANRRDILVYDLSDASAVPMKLSGHEEGVNSLCKLPCSPLMASGSDDCRVMVWDVLSGKRIFVLNSHRSPVLCVCPMPVQSEATSRYRYDLVTLGATALIHWRFSTGDVAFD